MKRNAASLRDYFGEMFEGSLTDPIEHIVVMTYEFDDQQLLNMSALQPLGKAFEPRRTHLARIAKLAPIVLYDSRKTKEATRLPHFLELLPVRMPPYTCHHPKAYLIVTRMAVHLVLGSMNLTATGLFENREVFETFRWTDAQNNDTGLLRDFVAVLSHDTYAGFASPRLDAAVEALRRRLAGWDVCAGRATARLLHQGYGQETGFEALRRLWNEYYGTAAAPERAIVVSPFFDRDGAAPSVTEKLARQFPTITALDVVTDATVSQYLCKRHFESVVHTRLRLIPQDISESERQSIAEANQAVDISTRVIRRRLHAKILILARGRDALVYVGSANFTSKAWDGGNSELGFVRFTKASPDALLDMLTQSLGAEAVDHFPRLPATSPAESPAGEDDYVEDKGYPDFVQGITLRAHDPENAMFFELRTAAGGEPGIQDYDVTWGKVPLIIASGRSQNLPEADLSRWLVGGRNLCFRLRANRERCFYLPFRHDASLFDRRELYVHQGAEDWMLSYLGVDPPSDRDDDERIPGDGDEDTVGNDEDNFVPADGAQRHENPVIRMQRYLTLFSSIEAEFRKRAQACSKAPAVDAERRWRSEVIDPLTTFAEVIAKEDAVQGLTADGIFKMGELALFCRRLRDSFPSQPASLLDEIERKLPERHDDSIVRQYLNFCRSELWR